MRTTGRKRRLQAHGSGHRGQIETAGVAHGLSVSVETLVQVLSCDEDETLLIALIANRGHDDPLLGKV
jgi:hypothetical protein